jgi:hypothetical protein
MPRSRRRCGCNRAGLLGEPAHGHVFYETLAQRTAGGGRNRLVHGGLLSVEGSPYVRNATPARSIQAIQSGSSDAVTAGTISRAAGSFFGQSRPSCTHEGPQRARKRRPGRHPACLALGSKPRNAPSPFVRGPVAPSRGGGRIETSSAPSNGSPAKRRPGIYVAASVDFHRASAAFCAIRRRFQACTQPRPELVCFVAGHRGNWLSNIRNGGGRAPEVLKVGEGPPHRDFPGLDPLNRLGKRRQRVSLIERNISLIRAFRSLFARNFSLLRRAGNFHCKPLV